MPSENAHADRALAAKLRYIRQRHLDGELTDDGAAAQALQAIKAAGKVGPFSAYQAGRLSEATGAEDLLSEALPASRSSERARPCTVTPAPWRIGDAGHTVFGPPNGNPSPETVARNLSRANARLIAAAPDLLAALEDANRMARNLLTDSQLDARHPTGATVRASLSRWEAAIAKARGA